MTLDPETRKSLQFICYKAGRCLREESFTPEDFDQVLIAGITPLVRKRGSKGSIFGSILLRWLGEFTQMPEIQDGARKHGGQKAVWGLNLFGKIVRKL